jgi:hypothetical protein
MNPADYAPEFDDSVREFLKAKPELGLWPISDKYCLQPASARILASLFPDPKPEILQLPPIPQAAGSPFTFSHFVPWLRFADGTLRNAGQLAIYWGMPGVPDPLKEAILDVATPIPSLEGV